MNQFEPKSWKGWGCSDSADLEYLCKAIFKCQQVLGWAQTELAARLMVSRQTVSDLLHERKSLTGEMAIRIAPTVGGTPDS